MEKKRQKSRFGMKPTRKKIQQWVSIDLIIVKQPVIDLYRLTRIIIKIIGKTIQR
jgi:hypothetical protein